MTEPTADFTTPPLDCIVGVRPWREHGYRLEGRQSTSNPRKYVVHNYGHGGAGITLSWGCASQVCDLVHARARAKGETKVAVLGSGVMGLTAATLIRELGLTVTVYAREFWEATTSRVAGAQWAPSSVIYADKVKFADVLKTSYNRFKSDLTNGFGISEVPNYTPEPDPYLELVEKLVPGLMPKPVPMNLPFDHLTDPGFKYQTFLIETPIFLKRLNDDLHTHSVPFKPCTFADVASVLALQENIIVNCTGLGGLTLWNDRDVHPIKGHLALLNAQSKLDYLFSRNNYLFPRTDAVIIGGTYRYDDATTNPDLALAQQLVDYMKGVFGVGPKIPMPKFHIDHPDNREYIATREVQASS